MASGKRHISVDRFAQIEEFSSKYTGRNPQVPLRDRGRHADFLSGRYRDLFRAYQERREQGPEPISEELGIYVEITSYPGLKLPLDKLDNRDFRLYSCIATDNESEQALVFMPESRRKAFEKKIEQYLDKSKDSKKRVCRETTNTSIVLPKSDWRSSSRFGPMTLISFPPMINRSFGGSFG